MNKKNCANCIDFSLEKIVETSKQKKSLWLSKINYIDKFILTQQNKKNKFQKDYDTTLKINLGIENQYKKILFWGTEKTENNQIINDAKKAYGNFSNHGITTITKTGETLLKLKCPQVYRDQHKENSSPKTYLRHVHFVYLDEKTNEWEKKIYTKSIICKYNYKEIIQKINLGYHVIINSLPSEYFAKDHIPNSYNLPYKNINNISKNKLLIWFEEIIQLHYPKLNKLLKEKKIELYEIPIVTYCYDESCNASEIVINNLIKKGFVNVYEYSGGMLEYRQNNPIDKVFKIK